LACAENFWAALVVAGSLLFAVGVCNAQTPAASNRTSLTGTESSTLDDAKSLADADHLTEAENKVRFLNNDDGSCVAKRAFYLQRCSLISWFPIWHSRVV